MAYEPLGGQDARASFQRRGGGRPDKIETARDPAMALRRLLGFLLPYRGTIILVFAFVILFSLLGLMGPWLMGKSIDTYIANKDIRGLARAAAAMLLAYFGSNLLQTLANWLMARVSQLALKDLRARLFSALQGLPMGFFDSRPAGGLMSRLTNDIDAINQAVSQNIIALVSSALSMIGILGAMFMLNHWLALASLVVIPIMVWFSRFVGRYTRTGFRKLQSDLGELNDIAEEAISGLRVIKAFRRGDMAIEAFRAKNRAVYEAGVQANSYAMLLMPLTGVLGSFFVIVLAGLGGWLALEGLASVGTIAAFVNYGQNFTSPLRQIANLYNSVQAALAGAERVFEIMDTPPEAPDPPGAMDPRPIDGEVSMEGIGFSYVLGRPVIRDFSLEAVAGKTIALVGPTGAGKTTIINLLTRFYEAQEGRIRIDGVDTRKMQRLALRRSLGLVLQDSFLFADTIMENIRYGRLDASDAECVEAAILAEADHFIRQLPEGYATNLSERAGNLSLGQRQLLAIARAILADPSILVLDEATSSVDTRTELRIQKALLRLMEGRTSFVIAHRLSTIRDADLVLVVDAGRVVERGSHAELLRMKGFYHRLYMSQFKGNEI
ncbi:MAG TPA: ABC transporter ATP-binding protein [Rectinemataceae bacterium]